MEQEFDGCLPFLDVLILKNDDSSFSHQVFRKKNHTEQYLNVSFHHFPTQNLGVLNTLATRALRISDGKNLEKEKAHLFNVFVDNDYSRNQGLLAFLKASQCPKVKKNPKDKVLGVHILFIQSYRFK